MEKLNDIMKLVAGHGGLTGHYRAAGLLIIPIFSWYDYSFGEPSDELKTIWMDYYACRWPAGYEARDIAERMFAINEAPISAGPHEKVITFSHFLPRKDLLSGTHWQHRLLYPVLGSHAIEQRLRRLRADIHVYGHSHVNRDVCLDRVQYVNSAIGYPREAQFTSRRLLCIHDET